MRATIERVGRRTAARVLSSSVILGSLSGFVEDYRYHPGPIAGFRIFS